jgi:putative oxidoreductase
VFFVVVEKNKQTMKSTVKNKSIAWHVALWIAQIALAALFLQAGYMKTFVPIDELSKIIPLAGDMPILTRFIGIVELLGGVGLILPALLRSAPVLTILAAYGFALIMVLALFYHLFRAEYEAIGTNAVLGMVAGFIAWGRTSRAPIRRRIAEPARI